MTGRVRWACAAAMAVFGCACAAKPPAPAAAAATATPAPSATPAPEPPAPTPRPLEVLPDPVPLGALTDTGVAVGVGKRVWFLDLHGRVLSELSGYQLYYSYGVPGVWFRRNGHYFRLDPRNGLLVPVPRGRARERMEPVPEPRLRPPADSWHEPTKTFVGHWRYTDESSTGVLLAQWSGECESPTAFWKERGNPPEIVTGGHDMSTSPESYALGWSPDDRAIVHLGEGLCGSSGNPPGIYSFTDPGAGTLLFETPRGATADIWP